MGLPIHIRMPSSSTIPQFWGSVVPDHWQEPHVIFCWALTEHEFRNQSLAQCGQDILVEYLCASAEKTFLDLGANDGITGSSTYLLEKHMWQGLLVEPNLQLVANLQVRRQSPVLAVGVGSNTEILSLYTSHVHTLGTMVENKSSYEYQRLCRESGGEHNLVKQSVAVLSVECIYQIYMKYLNKQPTYVKLDVEGLELPILESLLVTGIQPLVIEVENNTRTNLWAGLLKNNGFNLLLVLDSFVEIWIRALNPLPISLKTKDWLKNKQSLVNNFH